MGTHTLHRRKEELSKKPKGTPKAPKDSNIIIYNLIFDGSGSVHEGDAIIIRRFSKNIWIYQCDFFNQSDENISITTKSTNITISYSKFGPSEHDFHKSIGILIGNDPCFPADSAYLKVTLHNNLFVDIPRRTPRIVWGKVHVYNNYMKKNIISS